MDGLAYNSLGPLIGANTVGSALDIFILEIAQKTLGPAAKLRPGRVTGSRRYFCLGLMQFIINLGKCMSTAKFWCQNALLGLPDLVAWMPTSSDVVLPSKMVMSAAKLECLGTWCVLVPAFNKDYEHVVGAPDLGALMPTSSDVVLLSKWWCRPRNGGI